MENIITAILGVLGSGAVVGIIALILNSLLTPKSAAAWGKAAAKAIDSLAVKITGGEKNAEKLEEAYAPFIEQFLQAFIQQLRLDNESAQKALKKIADKPLPLDV